MQWIVKPSAHLKEYLQTDLARANKTNQSAFPPYDWFFLTIKSHFKDQYTIAIRNKFEMLEADAKNQSPNTTYNNFVTSYEQAAADVIPL